MSLATRLGYTHAFYIAAATAIAGISIVISQWFGFSITASMVPQVIHDKAVNTWALLRPDLAIDAQQYRVQIFSRDPPIIIIDSFVSSDEIAHLLRISEDDYRTSMVYGGKESRFDPKKRLSQSAKLDRKDHVVRRIEKRAKTFQGWRGNSTIMQAPTVQRYQVDGFFDYHLDWEPTLTKGNRVTTFMVCLVADCTGGGTNFPYLTRPNNTQWCNTIECTEEGIDGFQGVTFKPRVGSAVFWENFHPNGSGHEAVYHAARPVKSGVKVGLNMWSWDHSWRRPETIA